MEQKKNDKLPYTAPHLTVVTFKVEQGFTVSVHSMMYDQDLHLFEFNNVDQQNVSHFGYEEDWASNGWD